MILTSSIRDLSRHRDADEVYVIVRSLKRPVSGARQVQALSPAKSLFYAYLRWRDAGIWNADTFHERYEPTFRDQVENDPEAQEWLEYLAAASKKKKIVLACFCSDVTLCHRSIVADILREMGADVGVVA